VTQAIDDRAELLATTECAQARAADPGASAWVSANAGAGKTHVLMLRVLRLLLSGTAPERILCLTFTKAAASEMANRVFQRLSRWATEPDAALTADLASVLARAPTNHDLVNARRLFASAIETPGGLKVQTIHAFCERLLQRFPLEAGIPPGFSILDEEATRALKRDAINETLTEATEAPSEQLGAALKIAVRWAADDRFDTVLSAAIEHRDWLADMHTSTTISATNASQSIDAIYRKLLNVRTNISADELVDEMANVLTKSQMETCASHLDEGGKRDKSVAERLKSAAAATDVEACAMALAATLLTQVGNPRADNQLMSNARRAAAPALADTLDQARDRLHALDQERRALNVVEATVSLIRLAKQVLTRFADAKARRAALDYDDLIAHTAGLLSSSVAAEWVLYKLDGGLDHILVDEAQDTSPAQWQVIDALAAEFFAGAGVRETTRTLFAVGDEKQSIYGFQGAAPEMFAAAGASFEARSMAASLPWHAVPLRLSFRTVAPLLAAVDTVFADREQTPGLGELENEIRHIALRTGEAGLVEIWDPELPAETPPVPAFAPLDEETPTTPVARVADRIARTIRHWLDTGERLASQDRPIRAGDIMILVRKRQPFASHMVRALKARDIAVAGADQLVLADQIAIQDLMALGDFLTLPEDDLALAVVLKSPLFDLDDDDLLVIAPERRGTLWSALLAAATTSDRFVAAAETLKRWRALADFAPPFEFFSTILERDHARNRFLERLGPDAADPIDEFMNLALSFDEHEAVSLQGFLSWLRAGDRRIKRDMELSRDEVRVMTVHGAKGLEAPVVFLPDTCSAAAARVANPLAEIALSENPAGRPWPLAWKISSSSNLPVLKASRDRASQREQEEHNRLLYVAMTRARDRLYVAGFQTSDKRGANCWYDIVRDSLEGHLVGVPDTLEPTAAGSAWRIECAQEIAPTPDKERGAGVIPGEAPPEWATKMAPVEKQLAIPLAPSRLAPLDTDDTGEPVAFEEVRSTAALVDQPAPSPRTLGHENRFLRGTLTHALFEHLPGYPPAQRSKIAEGFVATRGATLSARVRKNIVDETLAVLADARFADVFGPQSRAEVPIVAEVQPPGGHGLPLRINGQIDRLARIGHEVLILDYKTNRPPPHDLAEVADAYLFQLAAYRLAIKEIFPTDAVRAAILWTDGARLMAIPDEILDKAQSELWELGRRRLDAA
jgi:ATP-dependent helicase/nuclease subunit A